MNGMVSTRRARARRAALALLALAAARGASAQGATADTLPPQTRVVPLAAGSRRAPTAFVACDGDTVMAIDIRSRAAASAGLVRNARALTARLLHAPHVPTRPNVIAAYLRLAVGGVCTERDRLESERLLRAQPFIASAAVRAVRVAPRQVRLTVDVVDELRLMGAVGVSRGTLSSLLLGTQDYQGRGLALSVHGERGFAYRDGYGMSVVQYGLFGRPALVALDAERRAVDGQLVRLELSRPYLTDLQRRAFHASLGLTSGYTGLRRPIGDDVSLYVRRTSYDIGWVTRLRRTSGRGVVALVGGALLGEDVRSSPGFVIVSDSGLLEGPANPYLFPAFATTRLAAIGGLRALRFITVSGFDALTAAQDMGVGVQVNLLAGTSILTPAHEGDVFVAGDLYAGFGGPASFFMARALAEARGVKRTHRWDGVVVSGRLAWYRNLTGVHAHLASLDMAGLQHLVFPSQLTFGDAEGGLPGFGGTSDAGSQRVVARIEERRLVHTFGARADAAVGLFLTAGRLLAGDVPFGRTTPVRAAAGITLLGASPGGKRTFRADLAFPLNAAPGESRFELRISSIDRTRLLWREPADVARVRTGAVPASLMKW
ncbi:MAG: BamA/TamA family outer membrane protein [Gemmatimonadaceae bacterium]